MNKFEEKIQKLEEELAILKAECASSDKDDTTYSLIEEARERYPIGTKFYPVHVTTAKEQGKYCIVTNDKFHSEGGKLYATLDEGSSLCDMDHLEKYGNNTFNRMVYRDGKWAEIVQLDKFEKGDYAIRTVEACGFHYKGKVFKVTDMRGNYLYEGNGSHSISSCRLATTEEIKEFLIRVAKEKGFVKGAKFHPINMSTLKETNTTTNVIRENFTYDKATDILRNNVDEGNVYVKGVWSTILPEDKITTLAFGTELFEIKEGNDYASTPHGKVTKQEIADAINYLLNPPKLAGYELTFFNTEGAQRSMEHMRNLRMGFGCKQGSFDELRAILKAFEEELPF